MKKEQKKDNNKLYDFDFETEEEKKSKAKRKKADTKSASKKRKQPKKETVENKMGQAPKRKKYDDEIIIGVTRYPEKENQSKKTKEKRNERRKIEKNREQYNVGRTKNGKNKEHNVKQNQKQKTRGQYNNKILENELQDNIKKIENRKKRNKILKILLLVILVGTAIVFALLSPMFNIQEVEVIGNKQVSKEELVSLSGININDNIFKISNIKTAGNVKQNAYVNEVKIHKVIPNKIKIEVTERQPSYMLEYGNGYVYVNNQGYMLEISSIKKELPILLGTSTSKEEYKAGNRLDEEDLTKLGTVIKIMSSAKTSEIDKLITKIDISNSNNYTLHFETERKIAYLGDCSNLETRMLFLVGILNKEKENQGEIFVNMNLNTDNAFFRESV